MSAIDVNPHLTMQIKALIKLCEQESPLINELTDQMFEMYEDWIKRYNEDHPIPKNWIEDENYMHIVTYLYYFHVKTDEAREEINGYAELLFPDKYCMCIEHLNYAINFYENSITPEYFHDVDLACDVMKNCYDTIKYIRDLQNEDKIKRIKCLNKYESEYIDCHKLK